MIYVADNILNYLIYLFICHFGFRLSPRKNRLFPGASILIMLLAGMFNWYFDTNSPLVYIFWSVLAISLFFEESLLHLVILSAGLMYFTGIIDSFSVTLIQVLLIGGGISGTDITWWMEPAYLLSFLVYLLVYFQLLKKNDVYLCDIELKYKLAILIQGSIFEMFYNYVFVFFNENSSRYGWNAYITFLISIAGVIYSVFLTLSLAIKNILSRRQNRELRSFMQMQRQQYDYQLRQSEAIRRFRHDLVNHIGVLRELVSQKRTDDARDYIDTIWDMNKDFDLKIHTGDSFLDVIMNYYFYLAEKEHVKFAVSGKLTEKLPMEMVDLTTLMGNVLQNAMEAATKTPAPEITVALVEHKNETFITVSNSVMEKINTKKGFLMTSKRDKADHGFGLKNIAVAVEKYHGEYDMDFVSKDGKSMFRISIAVPRGSRVCG